MRQEHDTDRGTALDEVLADYMRRADRGEEVDEAVLVAAHPELAEELRRYFSQAEAVDRFAGAATADFAHQATPCGALEVRCPGCHEPMEVPVDTSLTDLTCSACGSHFSLIDQGQATSMAPSLTTMGRFELIERLGVGGFGTVWKARDKQLDRTVAIKIPRAGGMTAEEQEKFFREARAAAQLRHPSIVSVHEVGRDGDSIYIVSDFVRGVTLGDWLTGQQLTGREAAELCAKIADALQHAHEQGVIHRDLKPANIMIDGEGQPHLMDFGLARREVGEVTVTIDGQVLGTPAYMSPEQALGESHTADRRSDVYSLGVILFQLLTGELPFRGNARMLVHQVINEPAPSPRKLNSNVAKDLETITLKCLEKEPSRRYPTAQDVAAELRRYLAGEPILARPISRIERAWQWCKRHRQVAALSAITIVALAAGTVISTLFAINARRQAEAAQTREAETAAVLKFVEDKIIAAARPEGQEGGLGRDVTLRQAIEAALPNVESDFSQQPLIEARLRQTLGMSFLYLGESKSAEDQFLTAHKLFTRRLGPDHPDTLTSMSNLAWSYSTLNLNAEALQLNEETLTLRQAKLGPDHPDTLWSMHLLAWSYSNLGRHAEALQLLEETLKLRKVKLGPDHPETLRSMHVLANIYEGLGRDEEALQLREETLALRKAKLGPDHPDTLTSMNNLAISYSVLDRDAEALQLLEASLKLRKAKLGPNHPYTLLNMNDLARCYSNLGRDAEALQLFEETLRLRKAKLGPKHSYTIGAMNELAWLLATSPDDEVRDGQRAIKLAAQACELSKYQDAELVDTLATAYAETDDYDSAVKWSQKALELLQDAPEEQRRPIALKLATYQARQRLPAESRQEFLSPSISELRALMGREQSIEFRVQAIGGQMHRYLNSKIHYRHLDCFTAVVEPSAAAEFDSKFPDPAKELLGKIVRVTGKIEERGGRLEIRVRDVGAQLKVLEPSESSTAP